MHRAVHHYTIAPGTGALYQNCRLFSLCNHHIARYGGFLCENIRYIVVIQDERIHYSDLVEKLVEKTGVCDIMKPVGRKTIEIEDSDHREPRLRGHGDAVPEHRGRIPKRGLEEAPRALFRVDRADHTARDGPPGRRDHLRREGRREPCGSGKREALFR